ncbi:phage tail sheath subtilisin-like domain-containing protein [Streptomyces sp. NPDC092307]|uniref:phage tail sheath subtilisin-like domain-containing protein n=1 Tax=Streptomyces sp. NPDC092307 TaxID=3366013 RepID=UPI00380E3FF9
MITDEAAGHQKVWSVSADGLNRTLFAGGGEHEGTDPVNAVDAMLSTPLGVAALPGGACLIGEAGSGRVRKVDANRILATDAMLSSPHGVLGSPGGGFYIAEFGTGRVRWVDASGYIHTVVGTGTKGTSGDGGPPEKAQLNAPFGMAVGRDGALYISDFTAGKIRVVAHGRVSTLHSGFYQPRGVVFGADGALYIATSNNTVWRSDLVVSGLAQAVYGHFANDGGPCWVARIPATKPDSSAMSAQDMLDCYKGASTVPEYAGTGLAGLARVGEVTMVAAPGLWDTPGVDEDGARGVQQAMAGHCAVLGNRMAILDPPSNRSPAEVEAWTVDLGLDDAVKRYAAVHYPWVKAPALEGGGDVLVPPSGHVAGVWCRSDGRRGVHKAPAKEALANTTDLEYHLTDGEQGELDPVGVNCLRYFPGQGFRVWGARTLSDSTDWRYLKVRRLINYLEESI